MFNGFPSTNTPAIQVWDFVQSQASTSFNRSVALPDDCAPIQFFRTGSTSNVDILVYLPSSPIEGKTIRIINQRYNASTQLISIRSSDVNSTGTANSLYRLGPGSSITLVYSKQAVSFGPAAGFYASGWLALDSASNGAANSFSAVLGGSANSAGQVSGVVAGSGNIASSSYCFIGGGQSNTANSDYAAILCGFANTANGNFSAVVGGSSNTSSGGNSFVGAGNVNTASAQNSAIIGGSYGTTRSIVGNTVFPASSSPFSSTAGVAQTALLILGRQTTDATTTRLASNNASASTSNQLTLPNNSAYYVRGSCIANVTGGGDTKAWTFEAAIKRGANAASTALVGTVIKNVMAADTGAATWDITISADTTNGALSVSVTGQAATTIRWVCKIETTEVTF